jgi:hypothetical protein
MIKVGQIYKRLPTYQPTHALHRGFQSASSFLDPVVLINFETIFPFTS